MQEPSVTIVGATSHDCGADNNGSVGGLIGHAGGIDGMCICDACDGGGPANCDHVGTSGGGDARDGRVTAWRDRDAAGGGGAARATDDASNGVWGRADRRGHG
jgi:hypothetical protein